MSFCLIEIDQLKEKVKTSEIKSIFEELEHLCSRNFLRTSLSNCYDDYKVKQMFTDVSGDSLEWTQVAEKLKTIKDLSLGVYYSQDEKLYDMTHEYLDGLIDEIKKEYLSKNLEQLSYLIYMDLSKKRYNDVINQIIYWEKELNMDFPTTKNIQKSDSITVSNPTSGDNREIETEWCFLDQDTGEVRELSKDDILDMYRTMEECFKQRIREEFSKTLTRRY